MTPQRGQSHSSQITHHGVGKNKRDLLLFIVRFHHKQIQLHTVLQNIRDDSLLGELDGEQPVAITFFYGKWQGFGCFKKRIYCQPYA